MGTELQAIRSQLRGTVNPRAQDVHELASPRSTCVPAIQITVSLRSRWARRRRRFVPCAVAVGGRPLARPAWSYDAPGPVLHATFRAPPAALVLRPCPGYGPPRGRPPPP